MKILLLSFILLLFTNLIYAQYYSGLELSATHPVKYHSFDMSRKYGGEIGFHAGRELGEKTFFETGLIFDVYGRKGYTDQVYEDISFMNMSLYIPLLFKYQFEKEHVSIKSGFLLVGHSLHTYTNYKGSDNIDHINNDAYYPIFEARKIKPFFNLSIAYNISNNIGVNLNYRMPLNAISDYAIMSIGINYVIFNLTRYL